MTHNDNEQFDSDLDRLLAPLKNVSVEHSRLDKWQKAIDHEIARESSSRISIKAISLKRRMIEWAVAASIGFVVAAAWMNITAKENDEKYFSGIDATEMHLVAKSD